MWGAIAPSGSLRQYRAGDLRLCARLIRDLDDRQALARAVLRQLWPYTGRAFIIGITGNPGAGKSTVVDCLIAFTASQGRPAGRRRRHRSVEPIFGRRHPRRSHPHAATRARSLACSFARWPRAGTSAGFALDGEVVAVLDAVGFDIILIRPSGSVGARSMSCPGRYQSRRHRAGSRRRGPGAQRPASWRSPMSCASTKPIAKAPTASSATSRPCSSCAPATLSFPEAPRGEVEIVRTVATRADGIDELAAAIARHQTAHRSVAALRRAHRARRDLRDACSIARPACRSRAGEPRRPGGRRRAATHRPYQPPRRCSEPLGYLHSRRRQPRPRIVINSAILNVRTG